MCSVAIDELPAAEAAALRNGRNPWQRIGRLNDPGLRDAEKNPLLDVYRGPPRDPVVVVLRCAAGQRALVARDHYDASFTDDDVIPVPAPCDLVLIVTADEAATLRIGGRQHDLLPDRTTAVWQHVAAPGTLDVMVDGAAHDWRVQFRGVDDFHDPGSDRARSKR